jgi:hypothetical protein
MQGPNRHHHQVRCSFLRYVFFFDGLECTVGLAILESRSVCSYTIMWMCSFFLLHSFCILFNFVIFDRLLPVEILFFLFFILKNGLKKQVASVVHACKSPFPMHMPTGTS